MTRSFLAGLLVVVAGSSAHAFPDVCTLANTDVAPMAGITAEEVAAYKTKINDECALSEKYQQMQIKARQRFGITLEQISEYQAMRYIRRSDYESAKGRQIPPHLTYQLLEADGNKPNEQRSSLVWDNFVTGIAQVSEDRARVQNGSKFELNDLLRAHRGFYRLSNEVGDFGHDPLLGQLRPPNPNDRHWWRVKADDVPRTKAIVDQLNEAYEELGLVPSALDTLYTENNYMTEILRLKPATDGVGMAMYESDSRAVAKHVSLLLSLIDANLAQARQGRPMIWKGHLMTPAQLAFLAQQAFVQIHPFSDGNGRTSRFVQELILTAFNLPPGSSGDLMDNDVLTLHADYYAKAITASRNLLLSVDQCLEKNYSEASGGAPQKREGSKGESKKQVQTMIDISALDQSRVDYNCRLVK